MPGAKRVNEMHGLVVGMYRAMFEELKDRGKKKLKREKKIKKVFNSAYKIARRVILYRRYITKISLKENERGEERKKD